MMNNPRVAKMARSVMAVQTFNEQAGDKITDQLINDRSLITDSE
jgi:hypothetical protein